MFLPFLPMMWFALGSVRRLGRTPRGVDGLTALRILFLSIAESLLGMLLVVGLIANGWRRQESDAAGSGLLLFLVVAFGCGATAAILWWRRRPLDASSMESLGGTYRTSFFVQVALAESPALIGLALSFIVETILPYLLGLGFAAVGFWLTAPTRWNLDRRQAAIRSSGSPLSLVEALLTTPPSPLGRR